ncbi:MAG: aldo/keto reductase [Candidatus Bathyarchaeota archaeon]|nr:aldo/keto reductase [Candidatus Bathyarchaeota archaeon]
MQKRRLGRTGLQVSQVGFGGTWISQLTKPQAVEVVQRAFDLGVTYFDTAKLDGDSEEKIGLALKDVRDECVIATKTGSRTKGESLHDLKESLEHLQTDRLDIIQLHGIDSEKTLRKATGEDGVLQMCKQARRQGLVDHIGITGHRPRVLIKAIETGEFDSILVPLNIVTRQALEELLPTAKTHDVGVAVMKPLMAKTSKLITCFYQPSLSLLSDEPDLKALLGQTVEERVQSALRFLLAQDISVAVVGLQSVGEVEVAAQAGNSYAGLTREEQERFDVSLGDYCRDCECCPSCPEGVDIAATLRFKAFFEVYGLENWARKLYSGLQIKADKCTRCGECTGKCPYNLQIIEELQRAHQQLKP